MTKTAAARKTEPDFDAKAVAYELLYADSEAQVEEIISSYDFMSDPDNWHPLDDRETNFNVTSNQASDGGKALTELMTNMVDAVLMKNAFQKGINPKDPKKAPKTMYEAVDKLIYNLRGGRLVNLESNDPWLRQFAQNNLVIGITGAKTKKDGLPCYTFVDNGEGQEPDDFASTFLSLSAGNKKSIPFVQGKFNMGSSGVLRYCGRKWYKFILSRRYDGESPWGWTLIRRRPDDGDNMPIAEYFAPGKKICRFDDDIVFPFMTMSGRKYDGMAIHTGTIVKLFDYQVGSKFLSFKGSRDALNENLVETILPFRLLDFRQMPKSAEKKEAAKKRGGERAEGIDPRPFYGMEFLLLRSHKEHDLEEEGEEDDAVGEQKIFVGDFGSPEFGKVTISAIVLKRDLPGWLKNSNNRVFHAVNGQVQYKQSRGFLSQSCGFPALKDRAVIIVDASHLTFRAHNEVWKGDREHISNTIDGEQYLLDVTETIKRSEALKELQNKIAKQELERATKAESNTLFQKLVDNDRNLAGLLSDRDPSIRLPSSGGEDGDEEGKGAFKGNFSPTFVRFEGKIAEKGIELPINKSRPVMARTDAENNYLNRADNKGTVIIPEEVRRAFSIRTYLLNGRLALYLKPLDGQLKVGMTFNLKIGLKDDAMPVAVETDGIIIRINEAEVAPPPPPPPPPPPDDEETRSGSGKNKKGEGKNKPTHGLPKCVLLTKDGREVKGYSVEAWPSGFDETEGGLIEDLGDEVVYKINYDNAYHIKYRESQRGGQVAKDVVTEKYILGMRILMLGYERALRIMKEKTGKEGLAEFLDDFRKMAAKGAASTVLALAENLPKIVNSAAVENAGEVE